MCSSFQRDGALAKGRGASAGTGNRGSGRSPGRCLGNSLSGNPRADCSPLKRTPVIVSAAIWVIIHCPPLWAQTSEVVGLSIDAPSAVVVGEWIYPSVVVAGGQDADAEVELSYCSGRTDGVQKTPLPLKWASDKAYGVVSSPFKPQKSGTFYLIASFRNRSGQRASVCARLLVYPGPGISLNAPSRSAVGNTIGIQLIASAGAYPLAGVQLAYSWDGGASGWTELSATGTPAGRIITQDDSISLRQAGTLSLRGVCWDVYSNEINTDTVRVDVDPIRSRRGGS